MKSYISAIVIFNQDGEKRYVDFTEGVNIITGDSKTGKSALVEIIDYCLCSSRCTIPKGRITDFGDLFCLIYVVNDKTLIIGRERWQLGGKMYFVIENKSFFVKDLHISYFSNKQLHSVKEVQYRIEQELGLQVNNLETDEGQKPKKASLRNMVSYMFQHQNLMASKFALFYRFSDFYKRQDTIDQFPIFAGYIGQEYYTNLIKLSDLIKELKKLQKNERQNEAVDKKVRRELVSLFKDYYALIGAHFENDKSIIELVKLSNNLPELDLSQYSSQNIVERYNKLNKDIEVLREKETKLTMKINELVNTNSVGYQYIETLNELKEKTDISQPLKQEYNCPLCGEECVSLSHFNKNIIESSNWLDKEIEFTKSYNSNFLEDIRKIEIEKTNIITQIKKVYGQIKNIERSYLKSDTLDKVQDKIGFAKAKIQFYVETINEGLHKDINDEISKLKKTIGLLEAEIITFHIEEKKKNAKIELETTMNRLAKTLDFEEEFKPINLNFDLSTFDLYHVNGNERIYLSEMGSGANWVSCHIVLFLSFLRLFAKQSEKSPMPLLLFFDQPSQVYFPQGTKVASVDEDQPKKQRDIDAVNAMYKTIFDEVEDIKKLSGISPQVIIVDHVDGEELEIKEIFKRHTRRNWRDGKALI
ncbi:hypothetical protein C2W64_01559 [Brevibacillus laterosporus]|nr:DUF3732 domain-containing protein [Brevibacillus laterosporus]RAP30367.1 hypothetical protein C2W64_01559 [Brevibacillus laterosporus]